MSDEEADPGGRPSTEAVKGPTSRESWLDRNFEAIFFELRLVLLIPVILSLIGSTVMFIVGSYNVLSAIGALVFQRSVSSVDVILPIIKALDAFLIGIVLIIFSFGVYDFFVSELDPAKHSSIRPDWFKFESTGELKNKLIEVVIVILSIKFFEQIIANISQFDSPALYLVIPIGAAILAISLGFFKWATE